MDLNSKNATKILIATLSVLLVVFIGFIYFFFFKTSAAKSYDVINFVGMTKEEVETWIEDNEVSEELIDFEYEFDEEAEKDTVIKQNLKENEVISEDTPLTLTLSNGYDPDLDVELIDFKGMNEDEIQKWFDENKFTDVTFEYEPSEDVADGIFMDINVEKHAKRSDLILVTISAGTDSIGIEITMPDLSDYTKTNIAAWAKTNHITVTYTEESSSTIAEGKVISQSPKAGTTLLTGGKASVTLSIGKGITVSNFKGKTKTEVQTWCSNNSVKCSFTNTYSTSDANTIVTQSVSSGTTISKNSTITFTVSLGKVPISDYTGKTYDSFVAYINGLGNNANIKITKNEVESTGTANTIISISADGKEITSTTLVDPGTALTVNVVKAKTIQVSSYASKAESELLSFLSSNGLTGQKSGSQYSDTITSGYIVSNQTGTFSQGSTITYVTSKGVYTVPADKMAKGASYAALQSEISTANNSGAGMTLTKTDESDSGLAKGLISACTVNSKTITCQVSLGVYVTVPKYTSNPCGELKSCTVDGLSITVTKETNSTAEGTVLSQSVASGTKVTEGTSVSLVISKGPEACPAGSTGNLPNCTCNDANAEWNGSGCVVVYGTTPDASTFDVISSSSSGFSDSSSKVKSVFSAAGFTNITIIEDENDVSNPNASNGVITSVSCGYGVRIRLDTAITVHITSTE